MKHPFDRLKGSLKSAQISTSALVQYSAQEIEKIWSRVLDRRICLGVTGFSGSGKSTFLTSFIYQLMHFPRAILPAFSPALQERLLGVKLHPPEKDWGTFFDFDSGIQSLSSTPPEWPLPTSGLKSLVLEIRYKPKNRLLKIPGRQFNRLFVEIRDYPGEWLLDLPMLKMSYFDWSHECEALYSRDPRTRDLGSFKQLVEDIDPFGQANEKKIREVSDHFVAFLQRCRESGLSLIQPGQFLLSASEVVKDTPFFPLMKLPPKRSDLVKSAPDNCYYKVLESRYKNYTESHVKPFYQHCFSGIDRQIVLVDLPGALNNGKACFEDMRTSLSQVLDSFQYGPNSLLTKLFQPRIDKVVFAASKIDQVLPGQHDNARKLMATLVYDAYRMAHYKQVDTYCEAIASVRATSTRIHDNTEHLVGTDQSGAVGLMGHPDIPDHIPDDDEWLAFNDWQLHTLKPPEGLRLEQGEELPHIRLDTVMRELLGDRFI